MKVCIAEKPSVAREIASVIGANSRRDGFFEGNGYQVTWTFGHLCTLKEPNDYDLKWKWWNLHSLPILPEDFEIKLISNPGVEKQFNTIATLVKNASEVINCGDAGQEGELIQRWVLKLANCDKPIKRLWISSLTEEAIKIGFQKLKDGNQFENLYQAGSSRAIGDWLLGMNATRLYTIKYGQGKQVLSIGRVQTPTLALIVRRHQEIENFKPQTFWELKTKYREVLFNSEKGRFLDKEEAEKILSDIKDEPFNIISIESKKAKEAPPRLFDLTSLQVECNKKYAYSADDTLKTVQGLYEKKFVTYPRVDTTYLSDDIFPKIPGILRNLKNYSQLTAPLLAKPIKKSNKVFDNKKVTDHHAIIPTEISAVGISSYEEKVYDLIVKRFISAFYPDCEVSNTSILGKVKETEFKANGRQILDLGWRAVYLKDASNEEENDEVQILPAFIKGESGPHNAGLLEKQTQAPKQHSEATLLRAMETAGKQIDDEELRELMKENGIGRPSTRAAVIETLFKRNYIRKDRKNLIPTQTGIELINTINNELLKSAELTGKWEFKLRQIEKGAYGSEDFLLEMKKMVSDLIEEVKKETDKRITIEIEPTNSETKIDQKDSKTKCPKCNSGIILKGRAAFGCSEFKKGCNFIVPFEFMSKKMTENQILTLIKTGKTPTIRGFKTNDVLVDGMLTLSDKFEILFKEQKVEEKIKKEKISKTEKKIVCPKCKTGEILKGNTTYGCGNWKNGCTMRIPFTFMDQEISYELLEQLISKGKTKVIKGLIIGGKKENSKFILDANFSIKTEK